MGAWLAGIASALVIAFLIWGIPKVVRFVRCRNEDHEFMRQHKEEYAEIKQSLAIIGEFTQSIARQSIVDSHRILTEKGEVTLHEYDALDKLTNAYISSGGNGPVSRLWKDIEALPIRNTNED